MGCPLQRGPAPPRNRPMPELRSDRPADHVSRTGAGPDLVAGFDRGAAGRDVFTIRDLTKEFGVSARTLRFHEGIVRLERQKAEIERAIAELARASLVVEAMLAPPAQDQE